MDIREHNRRAWDREVEKGNRWTKTVSSEEVARARTGEISLLLTPNTPVPNSWYPPLKGCNVLCLASGGGQQAPILAAAGAIVTSFDNSPKQLEQDALVAAREGLKIKTVEGDMRNLSIFADETFDFIFHPCSNSFVDSIREVWSEAYRVLKPGGTLVSGFANPIIYLFDPELEQKGILQLRFKVPFSDLTSLSEAERLKYYGDEPLNFGHSLEDQIAGQLAAGFHLVGFFEDSWGKNQPENCSTPVDKYFKGFIATRALKNP